MIYLVKGSNEIQGHFNQIYTQQFPAFPVTLFFDFREKSYEIERQIQ